MKKSELKQLIREAIDEMAPMKKPSTKYKNALAKKASSGASNKPYKLMPAEDPLFDGEQEMFIKGQKVASIHQDDKTGNFVVAIYRSKFTETENEYEINGKSFDDVAKHAYGDIMNGMY